MAGRQGPVASGAAVETKLAMALPGFVLKWLDGPFWETDLIVGVITAGMIALLVWGALRAPRLDRAAPIDLPRDEDDTPAAPRA